MRYRRFPFDQVLQTERNMEEFTEVKPLLVPMIHFPSEEYGGFIPRRLSRIWSAFLPIATTYRVRE